MDSMDAMLLALVIPLLLTQWNMSTGEAGLISSATLVGMMVGGIGCGILGDYFGRVRMLTFTVIFFSIFTGISAFAQDPVQLGIFRFFVGLGLGGEWGLGASLISEYWPKRHRAKATSFVHSGYPVGYAIASLLGFLILPAFGWRVLFLIGILPAFIILMFRRGLKEPPNWKEKTKKVKEEKSTFTLWMLFKDGYVKRTILASLLLLFNLGAYWAASSWIPTFLVKSHNLSLGMASWFLIVLNIGAVFGHQVGGYLSDKYYRKFTLLLGQSLSIVLIIAYMLIQNITFLFLVGIIFGFVIYGYWGTFGAYLGELYPTHLRSTGVGLTFNIGRIGGALTPTIVGFMAEHMQLSGAVLIFGSICYVFGIIVTILNKTEQVTSEYSHDESVMDM
ncbi:MFS transporter [Neobacillus pocheonensis]|uniref:MFS transporter n=1 Tax=Neobacillus pocheonensis TaxID=363869 RepID=UPI003D2AA052